MIGFINIIKPAGISSAKAVAIVKKKLGTPCGHMGTLDPMASGVLPIGVGKTSRLFDYLLDKKKTYIATFRFGILTDTLDTTGEITETSLKIPTKEEIESKLSGFVGEISQIPPKYSAKCVGGAKSYSLARRGVEYELPPKNVTVLSFRLINQISDNEFEFEITCKGGTYIRSLARDLGYAVNSLAVMSALTRTESGIFNMENGVELKEFEATENPEKYLIKSDSSISYPKLVLDEVQSIRLLNGLKDKLGFESGLYRVYDREEFLGVGEVTDGVLKIKAYVREN